MAKRFTTILAAGCASGTLLAAGVAFGQSAPETARDGIHDIRITIEQGYAHAQNVDQPTELDQESLQTSLGVSADLGQFISAGITGTYSHEDIASTNLFAMPMTGDASVLGADAFVTVKPLPFLHFGAMGGVGSGAASYEFTGLPIPATPGDSSTTRLGAFMSAFYGVDRLLLSASASVLDVRNEVDYGPGNFPQTDAFGATLLLAKLGVAYELTDRLTVAGGLTVNHVLDQDIASAQTGLDETWVTLEGGLEYAITPQFSVHASAATWLVNERMDFTRVAVGATYKF